MGIINLFCWTDLKVFESFLKEFSKKFKKFWNILDRWWKRW